MSSDSLDIVGVGDRLREEIRSGEFDRYVVFTYGITPEYLEWFEASDLLAVCGPSETVEAVREASASPFVSAFNRETHAKIYVLYNESRMVAYLGSFNFTRSGLYGNVEWGVRFEGELVESPPDPDVLVESGVETEVSQEPILDQVLSVVGASMTGADTDVADSWAVNTGLGEGVVHTLRSNTLQAALADLLRNVDGTAEIRYYTPFVTYRGVSEFLSCVPDTCSESEIDLTVLTKRLDRFGDDEEVLAPEDVESFDARLGAFRLRTRAAGVQGNELPDGRELRSGLAHLKVITVADRTASGTSAEGVILTSANLSKRAWSTTSSGFEAGVAVAGTRDSDRLHRFFTDVLPQCYVEPSNTMLATTGGGATRSRGAEEWLDARLQDRVSLTAETVTLTWEDSLPELERVTGTVSIRNIATGERSNHDIEFTATEDGLVASFPSVTGEQNWIIDFVRVVATSYHAPPELVYSGRELREVRAEAGIEDGDDPLPEAWSTFDDVIWNNSVRVPVTEARFDDVSDIKSARLVSTYEEPQRQYTIYEPDHQPHIDRVITDTHATERAVPPLGPLVRVTVETHALVACDPTDFTFYTTQHRRIDPVGFATDGSTIRVYFSPDDIGDAVQVRLQSIVTRYVHGTRTEIDTAHVSTDVNTDIGEHVPMRPWNVTPRDADPILSKPRLNLPEVFRTENDGDSDSPVVSNEMQAEITVPAEVQAAYPSERLAVWWRASGAFRTGTVQTVGDPIPKQQPRTRVTYNGIVTFQDGDATVNVWLPGGDYLVKEQPFVETLDVSLTAIPREQNLDRVRATTLLGWVVLQQADLLVGRARDVAHCVHAQLYVDGEMVPREIFDTTTTGGFLCIPVLGEHVGETRDLALRLWISDGPAKTTQYAEAVRHIDLTVRREDGQITVTVGSQRREIQPVADGNRPVLDAFTDTVQRDEFENQTRAQRADGTFTIHSYDVLDICPAEMLLLHFTDR